MTAEEMARELVKIRQQIADLKTQESELVETLAAEMPDKTMEIPGLGVFERYSSSTRKAWDNEGLSSALIHKLRSGEVPKQVDPMTGEVLVEDDIAKTARVFNECARPSWRLEPLRALDIQPDEYSEKTYSGTHQIRFTGGDI